MSPTIASGFSAATMRSRSWTFAWGDWSSSAIDASGLPAPVELYEAQEAGLGRA